MGNLILPLKCGFGIGYSISQKYRSIWVSVSLLDLNQNSGFGRISRMENKSLKFGLSSLIVLCAKGLLENIRTIPLIYPSEYIMRIYYDEFDETLKQVLEQKLDHLDLCDVNRLTFNGFRISGNSHKINIWYPGQL